MESCTVPQGKESRGSKTRSTLLRTRQSGPPVPRSPPDDMGSAGVLEAGKPDRDFEEAREGPSQFQSVSRQLNIIDYDYCASIFS